MNKLKLESLFKDERKPFRQWFLDHQLGIYTTVIVHLVIFLFLAVNSIRVQLGKQSVVIDFVHQAEPEKTPEELELEELARLEDEIQELMKQNNIRPAVNLPNIVVNAGAAGKGEGGGGEYGGSQRSLGTFTERSRQEKVEEKKEIKAIEGSDDASVYHEEKQAQGENYSGPSVVSYLLEGRQALSMPIPAYKCRGGGDVVVLITVDKMGYVVGAEVDKKKSSTDSCVQEAACEAAMKAKFTTSPTGAFSQKGNIVYRFVPQNR